MAVKRKSAGSKRKVEAYQHEGKKRLNNPPAGLVTPETDRDAGNKTYAYDPHIDPALQWAGKAELTSFQIPTVSLHVHERIDPRSIIEAVRKNNGEDFVQGSLFSRLEENLPIREAITEPPVRTASLLVCRGSSELFSFNRVQFIYLPQI